MSFRIGEKVVCVNERQFKDSPGLWDGRLKRNAIYEIRWVGLFNNNFQGGRLSVRLVGLDRGGHGFNDTPYCASRFRPLVTRTTDISIFTDMLIPHREKV